MPSRRLSGTILDVFGDPLVGVTIYLYGSGASAGQDTTSATIINGAWEVWVLDGWSGTVSAGFSGYDFSPDSIVQTDVTEDVADLDFEGAPNVNYFSVIRRQTTGVPGRTQAYRMQVEVVAANGVEKELFLYHRETLDPDNPDSAPADKFVAICSPTDIEEYPINAPDPDADHPLFRLATVDLMFRSAAQMDDTWDDMQADFRELARTLRIIEEFGEDDTNVYSFEAT